MIASDVPALLNHTRSVIFLEDGEVACLQKTSCKITDLKGEVLPKQPQRILWDPIQAEKSGVSPFYAEGNF